jgi:hypothetical protein
MAEQIYTGYADADAPAHRGWVLGHFMPDGDLRQSGDVEIKWAVHPRGDKRAQWVTAESRTAAIFLVSGRFRVDLPDRSVALDRPGAYIVFPGSAIHGRPRRTRPSWASGGRRCPAIRR